MDLDNIQRKYGLPAPLPVVQNGKFATRFPLNLEHRGDDVFQFGGKYIGEIENIYDLLYKILTNQEIDASLALPYAIKITEDKLYIRDKTNSEWITIFDIKKPNFPKEIELYELIYKAITHQVIGEDTSYPGQFKIEENILYVRDKDNLTWTQIGDVTKEFLGATEATQAILDEINEILTEVQELKTELNRQIATANETLTTALKAANEAMTSAQSINIRTFNSVEEMKASNTLKAGALAKTLGFYTAGDGGGADYLVTDNIGEDAVDEASIISLQKELYAKLLITDYINVKWFGAKFDDTTDDTEAIQKAINFCSNKNNSGTVIFPPLKKAIISETLTLPIGISIQGNKSRLITAEDIGWFIEYAKDSPAPTEDKTLNAVYNFKSNITDVCLDSTESSVINNGIIVYNNINIINLSTLGLNISVKKDDDTYIDFFHIKGLLIGYKKGEDYAVTLNDGGDGNIIEDVHTWDSENINAISVASGLQPIFIKNVINGNIRVLDSAMCKIEKIHLEEGKIIIEDGSYVTIEMAHIWKHPNEPIITVNSCAGLTINNVHSCYYGNRIDYKNDDCIDIKFNSYVYNFNMQNCFKKLLGKWITPPSPLYGIKTNKEHFNRNRTSLSKMCVNSGDTYATLIPSMDTALQYPPINGTLFTDPGIEWEDEETTNVSYTGTFMLDEDRKLACLSRNFTTESIDVTKGGNMVGINLNLYINMPMILIRNNNKRIIVAPIQNIIFDTGYMCGGEVWEDYSSMLEEDYQNCYGVEYNPQLYRDNIIAYMDNIPTKRTWQQGDIVKKYNISNGQTFSWICVSSGTPGTWKPLTTIQS